MKRVTYQTSNRKVLGSTPLGALGFPFSEYACQSLNNKSFSSWRLRDISAIFFFSELRDLF